MKCPDCGAETSEGAESCDECGYPIKSEIQNGGTVGIDHIAIGVAVAIAAVLVLSGVLISATSRPASYPEETLNAFADRMNEGDIDGAFDLTVIYFCGQSEFQEYSKEYSKNLMHSESYWIDYEIHDVQYGDELNLSMYIIEPGIEDWEEICGQTIDNFCIISHTYTQDLDGKESSWDGMALVVEIDSSWYLTFSWVMKKMS